VTTTGLSACQGLVYFKVCRLGHRMVDRRQRANAGNKAISLGMIMEATNDPTRRL
jgi:hypothetical protein